MAGDAGAYPSSMGTRSRLTLREHDVLTASARGANVREVAGELGVSEQEVRTALAAIVSKLGARSKLEALIIALRQGYIRLDS